MHISIHYQMRLPASGSTHLRHSKAVLARTPHAVGLHLNRGFLPSRADARHGSVEKSVHRGFTVSCKPRFPSVCRVFKQLSQGHSSPISGHSSFHVISWNKFVDISWQPSELIRCRGLDFPHFSVLWLRETGQICGFRTSYGERMGGMAWNLACSCLLTTLRTNWIFVNSLLNFLVLVAFWLGKMGQILSFRTFSVERMGGIVWMWYAVHADPKICLVSYSPFVTFTVLQMC